MYGTTETNNINDFDFDGAIRNSIKEDVQLNDPRLVEIVRLRLLSDPGFPFWDLSYCYGVLQDGTHVRVNLPEWQFPKASLKRSLVEMCKREGVYAKGLHILDDMVISKLY